MHTCFVLGRNPNVGVSLLAMASGQSTSSLPDPPPSRASPAPTGFVASRKFQSTQNNVGAGLLAMASGQPTSSLPDPPLSRAGSLPQGIGDAHIFCARQKSQCRSEPARSHKEWVVSFNSYPGMVCIDEKKPRLSPGFLGSNNQCNQRPIARAASAVYMSGVNFASLRIGPFFDSLVMA